MKSLVIRRPIMIAGRMTGVTVEEMFWKGLKEIAKRRHETLSHLVTSIYADRQHANLSSAIRSMSWDFIAISTSAEPP